MQALIRSIDFLSSCKVTRQRVPGSNPDDVMADFHSKNWILFSECKLPISRIFTNLIAKNVKK